MEGFYVRLLENEAFWESEPATAKPEKEVSPQNVWVLLEFGRVIHKQGEVN